MTRVVYTDLTLNFTPGTTTFPTATQIANDITGLYKDAAEHMDVTYSATVPDTTFLFNRIKAKMENHVRDQSMKNSPTYTGNRDIKPLEWSKDEIDILKNSNGTSARRLWVVEI